MANQKKSLHETWQEAHAAHGTAASDKMHGVKVVLEFTAPGIIMSDPAGRTKPPPRSKVPLSVQVAQARYLLDVEESDDAGFKRDPASAKAPLCVPSACLAGALKGASYAFKIKPTPAFRLVTVGVAVLPARIPLLDMDGGPLTRTEPLISRVPVGGDPAKGYTECGRAFVRAPFRTAPFELFCDADYFTPWTPAAGAAVRVGDHYGSLFLLDVLHEAGRHHGVMSWRPGAPKSPGPHGRFKLVSAEDSGVASAEEVYDKAFQIAQLPDAEEKEETEALAAAAKAKKKAEKKGGRK